jgi:hypothetical protein
MIKNKSKMKPEPMFDYSQFKHDTISMSPDKFIELPDFYRNRDVENRIPKMVKRLRKGASPTHLRVAVGKAVTPFGGYTKNQYFKLDGHTRTDVYKIHPELMPNVNLKVDVYEVSSHEEAMMIYDDIDSFDSVETSTDKVTGLLRERKYTPKSTRIKKGTFKTAVINACRYAHTPEGVYLNDKAYTSQFNVKLDYFWKELTYLDKMGLDSIERYSGNVLTAFLLIAKKYGLKNDRFRSLVENYRDGVTSVSNGSNVDGVHYVYNILYPENQQVWTQTGFSNSFTLISKILYGFEKFMNNETISKKGKLPSEQKLREFYQFYLS